jgi:hypothetical protein
MNLVLKKKNSETKLASLNFGFGPYSPHNPTSIFVWLKRSQKVDLGRATSQRFSLTNCYFFREKKAYLSEIYGSEIKEAVFTQPH